MCEFKTGDLVVLKSGGPKMTFSGLDSVGQAICVWFDAQQKRQSQTFDVDTIEAYTPPKPAPVKEAEWLKRD